MIGTSRFPFDALSIAFMPSASAFTFTYWNGILFLA